MGGRNMQKEGPRDLRGKLSYEEWVDGRKRKGGRAESRDVSSKIDRQRVGGERGRGR